MNVVDTPKYDELKKFTQDKLAAIRERLSPHCVDSFTVVACGSFARNEASLESDIDFNIVYDGSKTTSSFEEVRHIIDGVLEDEVKYKPSKDGAFNELYDINNMVDNIGGNDDDNKNITSRILYLLECTWLVNEKLFKEFRKRIIDKYVTGKITDHQLCRFLLNDVIRYYRTMCVDFEYKTSSQGKDWGVRNIKLLFSRKLIYFSTILVIAETAQRAYREKIEILEEHLYITPLERIEKICGDNSDIAITMYENFLSVISDKELREYLKNITSDDRSDPEFRKIKNEGHNFTWQLSNLLKKTFPASHPIHDALIL